MSNDIRNTYRFKVSSISREVNSFRDLLDFVIYDYEVIEIEGLKETEVFSEQEKNLIEVIIGYQEEIKADLELLRFLDDKEPVEITKMLYVSQKSLLKRKHRLNRGIFYMPTAGAYTSTTLLNKAKEMEKWRKKDNSLYVSDIVRVVKRTIRMQSGERVQFKYPYKVDSENRKVYYLEDLYSEAEKVMREGRDFKLINPRIYYSRETIRNINKIRKRVEEDRI